MNTVKTRRTIAALAAFAALAMGPATMSLAEGSPANPNNVALINQTAVTSLTIHKFDGTPVDQGTCPADGSQLADNCFTGLTKLADVQFKVTKVAGVDLTTNAGWEAAKTYQNNVAAAAANLDGAVTQTVTTDVDGLATAANLPIGLYYVQEISAPDGYTRVADFVVTLPMTNPGDLSSWMYNVNVYPKNAKDTATKTVDDKGTQSTDLATGAAADHVLDYTLDTSITGGLTGEQMGRYEVIDDLDPRLSYTGVDVKLSSGAVLTRSTTNDKAGSTADYMVFVNGVFVAPGSDVATADAVVKVVFTDAGLAKLAANAKSATVQTTIHTKVGAMGDGVIKNTGSFIPNQAWAEQNSGKGGIPTTQTQSKYGSIQILKHDAVETTKMLEGAQFTVFKDANLDKKCTDADAVPANIIGGPVTTDANGAAAVAGLQLSNFYNNAVQTDLLTYCLVETKAPTGYNLNAEPIAFTVTKEGPLPTTVLAEQQVKVANEKTNLGNALPLTGGAGVGALSGLALLLGAGGVGYYAVKSRRDDDDLDA